MSDRVRTAAGILWDAQERRRPCPPIRDLFAPGDVAGGYAVQRKLTEYRIARGYRPVGRKIGLTAEVVQRQLGVDQPDFGTLFDDMMYEHGELIPYERLLQPRVEAEIALILGADLDGRSIGAAEVAIATRAVLPAIEVVDSRIAGWDISIVDTIADNASSGAVVLGSMPVPLASLDLPAVQMTMTSAGTVVSSGTGAACLGNPLDSVAWLARTAIEMGAPLRAGEVVLSGALGAMVPVAPGAVFHAELAGLGTVTARFGDAEPATPR
ncbi:2-keto-4-pentenoate hydratase [Rhizomonospora bruguierae]|uniref:2-keto-4-pentenoate hydratase n=1 Tax=Rhizomonospora bruguierae TaxID=1581705 RepID=UPI001BD10424|nr:fumarylacetoacetate hydrolase family protein [Micromonospora sp. NBRC 107566]